MKAVWLGKEIDPQTFVPPPLPTASLEEMEADLDRRSPDWGQWVGIPRWEDGDAVYILNLTDEPSPPVPPDSVDLMPRNRRDKWGLNQLDWQRLSAAELLRRLPPEHGEAW